MFEKTKTRLEKVATKGNMAKLLVAGSLAVTGCADSEKPAPPAAVVKPKEPLAESLNNYRDGVNFGRKARVVLNSCVAWQNATGITVTQNPGVDTVKLKEGDYSYFVFSAADSDKQFPLIQQMNGPQALVTKDGQVFGGGPAGTILNVDLEKQKGYLAHATERKIAPKPTFADNGQIYHTDAATGEPLMNTAVVEGPYTDERVTAVCDALRAAAPIASLRLR
jgi:hypothetical protein